VPAEESRRAALNIGRRVVEDMAHGVEISPLARLFMPPKR
jgi:hypothetical protein